MLLISFSASSAVNKEIEYKKQPFDSSYDKHSYKPYR